MLRAVRTGGGQGAQTVAELLQVGDSRARLLATARNAMGRCSLHVAVLCQQEQLVAFLAHNFPETLAVGDNVRCAPLVHAPPPPPPCSSSLSALTLSVCPQLERTALHYAMGVEDVESLSKLLIKAGAKRVAKDLVGVSYAAHPQRTRLLSSNHNLMWVFVLFYVLFPKCRRGVSLATTS